MNYFGDAGQVILRMVGIFAVALIIVRLMGNRTVGQFSPFDFVLMVGIGDIVGNAALARDESLLMGVEGLVALLIIQQILSRLSMKSTILRKWFEGTPVVLIENGRILGENLNRTQFNMDDLRQELHRQGVSMSNLQDIKLARVESCGAFSLIKTEDAMPVTRRDLDNYIRGLSENPLSPAGAGWAKLQQLAADVRVVADYVRSQEAGRPPGDKQAGEPTQQAH
jgi:uncharacterized membrane protein YcaP (DUF421 family)